MSERLESETWFDVLEGLEDYRSDTSSVRSRSAEKNSRTNSGKSSHHRSSGAASASPPRRRRSIQSTSNSKVRSNTPSTGVKTPTISASTRKRVECENEARARVTNRARAYEALCVAEAASEKPPTPPSKDSSPSQCHPTSMQPGWISQGLATLRVAHELAGTVVQDTQTDHVLWTPQKPLYERGTAEKETEVLTTASKYKAYQPSPPPPVPPKDKPQQLKPKPCDKGVVKRKPVPLTIHELPANDSSNGWRSRSVSPSAQPKPTLNLASQGICPSRGSKPYEVVLTRKSPANNPPNAGKRVYEAYTPSPSPSPSVSTFPSQVRRMLTPPTSPSSRAPPSPTYSTTSIPPPLRSALPSPSPSPRSSPCISREPSPARGSWIADRPRQKRSSFVDRARQRVKARIHLNMQKAGVRPLNNFEVHTVRKGHVKDIASEWAGSPTNPTTPGEKVDFEVEVRVRSEERRARRVEDISGLERRVRRHQLRESQREKIEEEMRRGRSLTERARGLSFDAHAAGPFRSDSLFLGSDRPTSESFFASDWSQQQVIDQAKDMVAELPGSSSFHHGPFGKGGGEVVPDQQKAQGSPNPADDRERLPSQV